MRVMLLASAFNSLTQRVHTELREGMEKRGLIAREPNPADARSAIIRLLAAGRGAIEDAAPQHVQYVCRHFIDLFTPAELKTFANLNERLRRHLAEEPFPE